MNSPILNKKYLENNKQIYQYCIDINYMFTGEINNICFYIWDSEITKMSVINKAYKIDYKYLEAHNSTLCINKTTLENNDKPYLILKNDDKQYIIFSRNLRETKFGLATTPKQILQRFKIFILEMSNNSTHKYRIIEEYKKLCRKLIRTLPKYGYGYYSIKPI